jgi:predicted nucleic acid-binding protein
MFLLDTNTVSELKKVQQNRADPNVARWNAQTDAFDYWLSVVTVLELNVGVLRLERKDPKQAASLRHWLETRVMHDFKDRILPIDIETAQICAGLHVPDPKPERDSLIAATALRHGLVVVTRNVSDFRETGVKLLNPWEPIQNRAR